MKPNQDLDQYLDSMTEAVCTMDFRTLGGNIFWPNYDPLFAKSWTKRILQMIDDCQKQGLTARELVPLIPNMSELRVKILFDLWAAKYTGATKEQGEKIFDFYNEILKTATLADPYAEKSNLIHDQKQIEIMLGELKPATPDIAKKLGRAVTACYHAGHAFYSDMNPSLVYENYGPYNVSQKFGPKHILAVKQFENLRAVDIWPETAAMACDKISIVYVYQDINMRVDAVSHAIYLGDLINNLKYYSLKVDGREFPIDNLPKISEQIETFASDIFQKFQALDFERQKQIYIVQKAYFYKWIHEKLGQDWRPSQVILDEAKGKPLHHIFWPENKTEQRDLFRQILDPRTDFVV